MSGRLPVLLLGLVLLATVPATNPAATALPPFTVVYNFSNSGINLVRMTRTLRQDADGSYRLTSSSRAINILAWIIDDRIEESTHWQWNNEQPRPLDYQYHRTGGSRDRHVKLNFDWERGRVTNTINNDPWQMAIPDNTLDKLLYQLTLMFDLKAGRESLDYTVADGGKLKQLHFKRLGNETIKLPLGRLETIKLKHIHIRNKRSTTIWCAPSFDYLPVRIKHIDKDGREILMEAVSISGLPFQTSQRARAND